MEKKLKQLYPPIGDGGQIMAEEFLRHIKTNSKASKNHYHSYGLKHFIENLYCSYVSNDDVLAAAEKFDIPIKYTERSIPNGWIAIKSGHEYYTAAAILIHHYGWDAAAAWEELMLTRSGRFNNWQEPCRRMKRYFRGELNMGAALNIRIVDEIDRIVKALDNDKIK